MLILRSWKNISSAFLRVRNGDMYERRMKGPKKVARFEILDPDSGIVFLHWRRRFRFQGKRHRGGACHAGSDR